METHPNIEIFNGIALLKNDQCICKFIRQSGRLDHDQNLLPRILPHLKKGDVVIDAGGLVGDHTITYARAVGQNGKVYAFEPSADSFKCLQYNMRDFANTICLQVGLGSEPKRVDMILVEGNEGMNYMASGDSVEIVTLDSMSLDRVNFIKIDVEGYELDILKGATETIKKFKPKMLIEINQMALERMNLKREDIFQFLDEHGYAYANIYPNQSINEYQLDILCLPK